MKQWICLISTLFMLSTVFGYNSILVNQNRLDIRITEFADYLQVKQNNETIQQVTSPEISRQFAPVHGSTLKFNQFSADVWLTFTTNNPTGRPASLYLVINAPLIANAEVFYDIYAPQGYQHAESGYDIAYKKRPYQMGNIVLPLDVLPGEQQIYLKLSAAEAVNVDVRLVDEATLLESSRIEILATMFWLSILFCVFIAAVTLSVRFRHPILIWAALLTFGLTVNVSGWNGSIAWWLSGINRIELFASNFGAFLALASIAHILHRLRADNSISWLDHVLIWLGRGFLLLTLLTVFPISTILLPVQIMLIPIALIVLSIFWFEHSPESQAERFAVGGFIATLIFFSLTTLLMVGMVTFTPYLMQIFSILALVVSGCFIWAGWLTTKTKGKRIAVEGINLPKMHWPLLRKLNHDIRGPINGVLGMTELLQDTTLSAHQQEFVNTIQTAGFSLLREADQLQNLIRIGLNRIPDIEDEFDLYDLIEDTVQPFSRIAHSKQLELVLDIAHEIPIRYRGNAHMISQILANLIDNALRYTDVGEVLVQVKPWQNGRIRFSITDTGPGIAKDTKSTLFQLPDAYDDDLQPKDVHLGLPICKYLVSLLGGQLSLSSELRMGTTFWIDLPLEAVHTRSTTAPDTGLALEDLRIMVVDDNLTCRKVIEHLASNWGAEVLCMSNGQSAMANLHNQYHKGEPVDVLILDQKMPNANGTEIAQRIRQDNSLNKDIVIMMMTGSDDVSAELERSDTGIEFVMSKPVSARALKETLKMAAPSINRNREKKHAKNSLFY